MAPSRALLASALTFELPFAANSVPFPVTINHSHSRRHSLAPIRVVSSHQAIALIPAMELELERFDISKLYVDATTSRDSISGLASVLVAGAFAIAIGCSTPHLAAAYAAEGVTDEASTNFQRSCVGCHAGGGNILQPEWDGQLGRNISITYFGKGRMPGYGEKCTPRGQCTFGPRLSDSDIRALAEFVRLQADQGWADNLFSRDFAVIATSSTHFS